MRNILKRAIPPIPPIPLPEHPRIKDRTSEQQKYRDELANNLKADRALGKVGKLLAEDRLKKEQKSEEYIVAKYGFTKQWARELIKAEYSQILLENIEKFKWLDAEIAKLLIEAGEWEVVAENIKSFEWVDHNEIAKMLIEAKKWWWWNVVKYIKHFEWVDHNEIAKMLIEIRGWSDVARYIKHFEWVAHNEIAKMLIDAGEWRNVARYIKHFEGLDVEIVKMLIELGYVGEIRQSIESSEQSEV